jgi:hypothetical protein
MAGVLYFLKTAFVHVVFTFSLIVTGGIVGHFSDITVG